MRKEGWEGVFPREPLTVYRFFRTMYQLLGRKKKGRKRIKRRREKRKEGNLMELTNLPPSSNKLN